MKVIILASGMGTRLRPLTDEVPKCMVKVNEKSIIDYQLEIMKKCGINESDILVIAGYKNDVLKDKFKNTDINVIINNDYDNTNMVYSLMCARNDIEAENDIIISYGDIIYSEAIFRKLLATSKKSSVVVDDGWYNYWKLRNDNPLDDAETLKFDEHDRLTEIGQKTSDIENIMSQYIGLMRFRNNGLTELLDVVKTLKNSNEECQKSIGKEYNQIYMTDLLQYMVERNKEIYVLHIERGWFEIDNQKDLKIAERTYKDNHVKYNIQIEGVFFDEKVSYNFSGDIIKRIILMPLNGEYELTIELVEKFDETILGTKKFANELNYVVNRIKLVTKKYVGNPVCVKKHVGTMRTCDISGEVIVPNKKEFMELLRQGIEDDNYEEYTDFKKEFLDALSVENHYARFILLYGILYDLMGSQRGVDDHIIQYWNNHNQNQDMRPSRKYPGINETIYTYLRNCYGHLSDDVCIENTNNEIDDHIEDFTQIVYDKIF